MAQDIQKIKNDFVKSFRDTLNSLRESVATNDTQWTIKGFLDVYRNLYTISSDTKVVSKILEIHLFPILNEFANKMGYKIEVPDSQNHYPDLTYTKIDDVSIKFAVDIKTTFRRYIDTKSGKTSQVRFTLGSHGSYFKDRDLSKNIKYPYNQYKGHFCLAIVYTQAIETKEDANDFDQMKTFKVNELGESQLKDGTKRTIVSKDTLTDINSVIKDIKFYFVEKWKIASDGEGSGNTANIGSTITEDNLDKENGVFYQLGEAIFDDYWKNYDSISFKDPNGKDKKITNIWDYLAYRNRKEDFSKVGEGAKKKPKYYDDLDKKTI